MFKQLQIGMRLYLGFGVVIVLTAALAVYAILNMPGGERNYMLCALAAVVAGGGKAGLHARQRAQIVGVVVADDRGQRLVAGLAAVGVDQDLVHLGPQSVKHVVDERAARQLDPALVGAPHAGGTAAGQHHGGDGKAVSTRFAV